MICWEWGVVERIHKILLLIKEFDKMYNEYEILKLHELFTYIKKLKNGNKVIYSYIY